MSSSLNNQELFPIWKSITIGTYGDVNLLEKAILDNGFRIGDWADDVLHGASFTLSDKETSVDLVRVTAAMLNFSEGSYRNDIYTRATQQGLKLCPLEVGPQLRLQYKDQPRLESLQIEMEPQKDSENHESEFRVVHGVDGCLWLVGDHKHPNDFWQKDEYFIFLLPPAC